MAKVDRRLHRIREISDELRRLSNQVRECYEMDRELFETERARTEMPHTQEYMKLSNEAFRIVQNLESKLKRMLADVQSIISKERKLRKEL
ncbi:hypothetical protein J4475_04570 [Candidatus Woesearchaeota archaeon]|nr:hypothetical protein [Candidatus Woesearchaeota archaeon]